MIKNKVYMLMEIYVVMNEWSSKSSVSLRLQKSRIQMFSNNSIDKNILNSEFSLIQWF